MKTIILTLLLVNCFQSVKAQPDNRNREREQQQTAGKSALVPVDSRQAEIDKAAIDASEAYRKERDAKEDAFRDEQSRQNKVISDATVFMARMNAVNVGVAIGYGIFAFLTLLAVYKQAKHANEQVGVTKKQLTAMDRERSVLQRHGEAMFRTARYTKEMLNETRGMAKTAEDNAKTARDAFYVGSAPYFGITSMEFVDGPVRVGHCPTLQITFLNGGRTPAWLFYAEVTVTFGDSPDSNIEGCSWILFPERDDTANSFIPHNESRTIKFWNQFFRYTEEMQRRVNQDSNCLFVNVVLTYRDFRKRDHKRVHDFVLRKGGYFSDYRTAKAPQPEKEGRHEENLN